MEQSGLVPQHAILVVALSAVMRFLRLASAYGDSLKVTGHYTLSIIKLPG